MRSSFRLLSAMHAPALGRLVSALVTAAMLSCGPVPHASGQSPFVPNDPYFAPDVEGDVTEEGYYGQWHLRNQMPVSAGNAGLDANVWGAWQRGLTGSGVVISIVDDGTQGDHPDIQATFRNTYSWDYGMNVATNNAQSYRGMPQADDDSHGTAVAGVASAIGGNGLGVTGAAPGASIAAQRLLMQTPLSGGISENRAEAAAIGFQGQKNGSDQFDPFVPFAGVLGPVRVMNHSYGPNPGYQLNADSELLLPALAQSAARRVIHTYAAGNQRNKWTTQDSNTILTNTSPDVIVVAALGSNGTYSDYSSFGANVLITAPSSSREPVGQFSIATADRTGLAGYNTFEQGPDPYFAPASDGNLADYTSTFGGTSSAAPLAAGIMALGIEANSDMDLRMARHLLARTSRPVHEADSGWITNAAGNKFNRNYGFGLIDADAFTLAATQVDDMTPLEVVAEPVQTLTEQAFTHSNRVLTQTYTVSRTDPLPLEYVQVTLSLSDFQTDADAYRDGDGAILGDIFGTLTSPLNTTYQLFSSDRNLQGVHDARRADAGSLDWTFISYAYFGEELNGDWTLALHNDSANTAGDSFGQWDSFRLTFGTGSIAMVPEPSSLILLAIGGVWAVVRRGTGRRHERRPA